MQLDLILLSAQAVPATSPPGIFEFFLRSGLMAKAVLGSLVLASIASWAIMLGKAVLFRRSDRQTRRFLEVFRSSKRFGEVNAVTGKLAASPLVGVFLAGYTEVDSQIKAMQEDAGSVKSSYRIKSLLGVERSLRRAAAVETHLMTRGLQFLATTAAASPFVGLFGTVWGIMIAFRDIGLSGSTSLVAVAPGIAEALVNTAAGLAAAIPALVGYNYFGARIRRQRSEMDDFVLEFLNLSERNFT